MMGVREKAAGFADVFPDMLQHVLVTEYSPRCWHRLA